MYCVLRRGELEGQSQAEGLSIPGEHLKHSDCIILRNVLFVNAWSDISVQFGDMSSKARTVSIFITDILRVDRWILYTRLHHDFCLIFECF